LRRWNGIPKKYRTKSMAFGWETQKQAMIDFTQSKVSSDIPKTSYVPGTTSVEMGQVFLF
jgi:hypothetical protein